MHQPNASRTFTSISHTLPSLYDTSPVTPITNRDNISLSQSLHSSPIQSNFNTPRNIHASSPPQTQFGDTPLSHRLSKTFTSLLQEVDDELDLELAPKPPVRQESSEFTVHFTSQFEELKAEVEGLHAELKQVKRTVRELKVRISMTGLAGISSLFIATIL